MSQDALPKADAIAGKINPSAKALQKPIGKIIPGSIRLDTNQTSVMGKSAEGMIIALREKQERKRAIDKVLQNSLPTYKPRDNPAAQISINAMLLSMDLNFEILCVCINIHLIHLLHN
jgi:hypothetical protein